VHHGIDVGRLRSSHVWMNTSAAARGVASGEFLAGPKSTVITSSASCSEPPVCPGRGRGQERCRFPDTRLMCRCGLGQFKLAEPRSLGDTFPKLVYGGHVAHSPNRRNPCRSRPRRYAYRDCIHDFSGRFAAAAVTIQCGSRSAASGSTTIGANVPTHCLDRVRMRVQRLVDMVWV